MNQIQRWSTDAFHCWPFMMAFRQFLPSKLTYKKNFWYSLHSNQQWQSENKIELWKENVPDNLVRHVAAFMETGIGSFVLRKAAKPARPHLFCSKFRKRLTAICIQAPPNKRSEWVIFIKYGWVKAYSSLYHTKNHLHWVYHIILYYNL